MTIRTATLISGSCLLLLGVSSFIGLPKKFIPPGTAAVSERLYADKTEITNQAWREFEIWTSQKYGSGSAEHLRVLPDTSLWLDKNAHSIGYATYYYKHPAYKDFPVVGISHTQALAFCQWRTAQVKRAYFKKHKRDIDLTYRLPTEREWEMFAMSDAYIVDNGGKNRDGKQALNCYRQADTIFSSEERDILAPVISYFENDLGLWQCLGNVAEMVADENIAKGGSWRHPVDDCRVGKDIPYTKAQTWLGFRCVCTLEPN